jgi:hypothetical protein
MKNSMTINVETFIPYAIVDGKYTEGHRSGCDARDDSRLGTVEVTLMGKTKRVVANKSNVDIYAYGIAGRYKTGTKVWSGTLILCFKTNGYHFYGGMDHRARFSTFHPTGYFYDDVSDQYKSKK